MFDFFFYGCVDTSIPQPDYYFFNAMTSSMFARTTDTQWRHKSKIFEKLGRCGRQNMLRPYLKIWDWDWIFGRAVKAISSLCVRSPCMFDLYFYDWKHQTHLCHLSHSSEVMGKTFQAAQLSHERFLTIVHSCKIFFWYLPNWTSTDLWCVSSVWQISKKCLAGLIYGQKYLIC